MPWCVDFLLSLYHPSVNSLKTQIMQTDSESLDDESPTSANLGKDHGFIIKEYSISISTRPFGEAQSKATRAYAQSGQYHAIVETRDSSSSPILV